MRILEVTGTSSGGVGRHVREACGLLADDGHRVMLAAPAQVLAPLADDARVRTVELDISDRPRPQQDATAVDRLRRLAGGADVLHAHGLRAGALAVLAARSLPRRPGVVVTLHNRPVGSGAVRAVGEGLLTLVATGADIVLGVSGDLVRLAAAHGARDTERALVPAPARVRASAGATAGTGVDARPALPEDLRGIVAADELVVLTVARLAPQKGLDLLADAARRLTTAPETPPWRWLVVGDGPLEAELRREVADLPVEVLGRREDVGELMAAADVVVNTSVWEGQPLVVQEALAAGAAVVATDVGGTGEVCRGAAQLVPFDAQALTAAVAGVLRDDLRREAMRTAAVRRAGQLPTPAHLGAQLRSVLGRAARNGRLPDGGAH